MNSNYQNSAKEEESQISQYAYDLSVGCFRGSFSNTDVR
jgi:hypothetical protein